MQFILKGKFYNINDNEQVLNIIATQKKSVISIILVQKS